MCSKINRSEHTDTAEYAQLNKNTVKSQEQLKDSQSVRFENVDGKGIRIMFIGNSITLHGVKPDIGWYNEWGMAASAKEKDYVHRLMSEVKKTAPDAAFCICQVAGWERQYNDEAFAYNIYENAQQFGADVIIMRFIENCPGVGFDAGAFKRSLRKLFDYLDPNGKAKIILTTGFWKHPGDAAIVEYGKENGLPVIKLGDLGEDNAMKAIGLFEHGGVANHPGDLGMEKIAQRIFSELKQYL